MRIMGHHLTAVHLEIGRNHFVLKSRPKHIIVLSVIIPDSSRHHVQLRSIDAAPQLAALLQCTDQHTLRHIGRKRQQLTDRLFGTQRKVRRTLFRLCLFQLQLPLKKGLIIHQAHLLVLLLIIAVNLSGQQAGQRHHPLSASRMGYHHVIQMRRVIHLIVQYTHLGQTGADIGDHRHQQHIAFPIIAGRLHPLRKQIRQMLKHLFGKVRSHPTKFFTFSEQHILHILFTLPLLWRIEWPLDFWPLTRHDSVRPPGRNILITRR